MENVVDKIIYTLDYEKVGKLHKQKWNIHEMNFIEC